uniref:Uncharacterized protein n=1 Tax=Anguilla anguilla TaxID=7936 RepID=A0A0E9VUX9_ANGAN
MLETLRQTHFADNSPKSGLPSPIPGDLSSCRLSFQFDTPDSTK